MSRLRRFLRATLVSLTLVTLPTFAAADLGELAKSAGADLVAPLAEKFGVPAEAVSALLGSGLDLEGAVQALLVSQAAGGGLDQVSSLLGSNGNDVAAAASSLGVDASTFAPDKVSAVLGELQGAGEVGKAVGDLMK